MSQCVCVCVCVCVPRCVPRCVCVCVCVCVCSDKICTNENASLRYMSFWLCTHIAVFSPSLAIRQMKCCCFFTSACVCVNDQLCFMFHRCKGCILIKGQQAIKRHLMHGVIYPLVCFMLAFMHGIWIRCYIHRAALSYLVTVSLQTHIDVRSVEIQLELAFITQPYGIYANLSMCVCCLLYTSPSPRDISGSRMPSSA